MAISQHSRSPSFVLANVAIPPARTIKSFYNLRPVPHSSPLAIHRHRFIGTRQFVIDRLLARNHFESGLSASNSDIVNLRDW